MLDIDDKADDKVIKKAYRKLAMVYHPVSTLFYPGWSDHRTEPRGPGCMSFRVGNRVVLTPSGLDSQDKVSGEEEKKEAEAKFQEVREQHQFSTAFPCIYHCRPVPTTVTVLNRSPRRTRYCRTPRRAASSTEVRSTIHTLLLFSFTHPPTRPPTNSTNKHNTYHYCAHTPLPPLAI